MTLLQSFTYMILYFLKLTNPFKWVNLINISEKDKWYSGKGQW